MLFLKKENFLGRCQYQNKKAFFTDPIFSEGFGLMIIILVICAQVTMTVDGTYREKWTTSGTFSMLSSNKVFIGGSSQPYKLPGANTKTNFVGCMKKVCFYP